MNIAASISTAIRIWPITKSLFPSLCTGYSSMVVLCNPSRSPVLKNFSLCKYCPPRISANPINATKLIAIMIMIFNSIVCVFTETEFDEIITVCFHQGLFWGLYAKIVSELHPCQLLGWMLLKSAANIFMAEQVRPGYPTKTNHTVSCCYLPPSITIKEYV